MKSWLLGPVLVLALVFLPGCGSLSSPTQTTLSQTSLLAVQTIGLFAKGVEDLADAKVITVKEAHQILDPTKDVVKTIKAGNQNTVALFQQLMVDLNKLPFAGKLQGLIFAAQVGMGLVRPPATAGFAGGNMDGSAVVSLVMTFLPAILGFIKRRRDETGQDPTVDEIKAHVIAEADVILADIDGWEARNPVPADDGA